MEFVLDLLQGAGIAAAIGIRPFLPVLLVGALASADLGIDFDGTDFAFLEEWPFLLAVLVLVCCSSSSLRRAAPISESRTARVAAARRSPSSSARSRAPARWPTTTTRWLPGIVAGAAAAALGFFAARSLFGRVRRRLDPDAQGVLPLYGEGSALAAAGASVLFPPLAILVLAGLAWLLAGGRRREGEKYAGLRILR